MKRRLLIGVLAVVAAWSAWFMVAPTVYSPSNITVCAEGGPPPGSPLNCNTHVQVPAWESLSCLLLHTGLTHAESFTHSGGSYALGPWSYSLGCAQDENVTVTSTLY